MKKVLSILFIIGATALSLTAQKPKPVVAPTPYDIKVSIKGAKDSAIYLAIYTFDKQYLVDTAARAKDGTYTFKKKRKLDGGMYMLISQGKSKYLDFIVDENDKFGISFDTADVVKSMKFTNSKENDKFLELVKFMAGKTKDFMDYKNDVKAKKLADSTKLLSERNKNINAEVDQFRKDFLTKNPTGFVSDFVRLQMEPNITNPPKAANGRPDSIWQYQYYKNNYWKDIPLGDERILHTPIFGDKMKNYFSKIVLQIPDSINKEIINVVDRTKTSKEMFKWVVFWMTNWSETNKVMGFDAVFVHIVNKYYRTGQVDFYTKDQLKKIIDRADILEPLLLGRKVPELLLVDTNGIKVVKRLKLDTCKTSKGLTDTYTANKAELDKQLISLHAVKADYTVLVFWDIDCGHCKKEIPVLMETFKALKKEGMNIKVHAVYTQHEYDKWLKTLKEMELIEPGWVNVTDGVHLQNLKEKFDIFSTPVIYILDKNKTIRYKRIAADQLNDVMKNLQKANK